MSLMQCPNEILDMIAAHLDSVALVALAGSERRFQELILKRMKHVKLNCQSKLVERYLFRHSDVVRHLDLSDCRWLPLPTSEIINYLNLTKLDLVNTRLWDDDLESILNWLSLESLSFSMQTLHCTKVIQLRRSSRLKELYVELQPNSTSFRLVIDLMNALETLEHVHVNLVGKATFPPYDQLPSLDYVSFKKLLTFVCSCHLADDPFENVRAFLKRIFEESTGLDIDEWFDRDRYCYIYERGFYNTDDVEDLRDEEELEKLNLLKNFYVLDLASETSNNGKSIRSPWGHPKSLRVKASHGFGEILNHYDLSRVLTTALVEVDFTDYHRTFSAEFWRDLVWSSPHLESLAIPLCSFLVPNKGSQEARKSWKLWIRSREGPSSTSDIVEESLRKLNLRKLFVKGNAGTSSMYRYPYPTWQCPRCSKSMTARNTPQLKALHRLEELTFKNVTVESSALRKMANPFPHTVRLRLNRMFDLSGMRTFIQECHNLRNLKLTGFNMPLHTQELWQVIAGGKKLKELCLGTRSLTSLEPSQLRGILLRIPRTLLLVHFHLKDHEETFDIRCTMEDTLKETGRFGSRYETKFLPEESSFMDCGPRDCELSEPFLGRALCHTESFAGFVTPVQWDLGNHR